MRCPAVFFFFMKTQIDLNVDCGESFGHFNIGEDEQVLKHVSSANIACGAHAGDPDIMRQTVRAAKELGIAIGAHPGYPDIQGFGRRIMHLSTQQIVNSVLTQIGALYAICRAERVEMTHVKPHGALYTHAAVTGQVADALARAVALFSRDLVFVGMAGSLMIAAAEAQGLHVAREAFADRAYQPDGTLRTRNLHGAMIEDNAASLAQVVHVITHKEIIAYDGTPVHIEVDTICLHGDTTGASARAAYLRRGLEASGIKVAPLDRANLRAPKKH
jgi:UPF0271 protein